MMRHMATTDNKNRIVFEISNGSILRVAMWLLLGVALYYLWELVLVILTAIVIASFIQAASRKLARYRINRTLTVVVIYLVVFALIALLFYLFVPIFIVETSNIISLLTKYLPTSDILQSIQTSQQTIGAAELSNNLTTNGDSLASLITNARLFISQISLSFIDVLTSTFGGMVNVVLISVVSFYLSIEEKGIEKFLRLVTPLKNEVYILDLWKRTQRNIALWIKGQLILGLIVGVLVYLGLAIIGVHYAFILAIAAALFELIPFGIVLAAVPAISFAYIDGGLTLALIVAGFYIVVQQFEAYVIQPLLIKRVVGISPLVVILSILIGAKLAGFWGLILAIPVAVAFLEFTEDLEKKKTMLAVKE